MSDPIDIAAQAISESHNDLSSCRYYLTVHDSSVPTEQCSFGCYDEPRCDTCNPGPWPAESIRARYPAFFHEERAFGEPDEDNYLDAVAVLEDLRASGWRLVRVADAWAGDNGGMAMLVDEEWTPEPES